MGKVIGTLLLVIVLVIAGGAWWLYRSLDSVVASAIRSVGPEITGVDVGVQAVKILPTEGAATITGLSLGNPSGFKTPKAVGVGEVQLKLDVATVTKDVVRIREVQVIAPQITYEYASGGSNLDVIQRQVEAYLAQHGGSDSPKDKPAKKFIIDQLRISGAKVDLSTGLLQGKALTMPLADVHLKDIGKKNGGATGAEVAREVMGALTKGATNLASKASIGGAVDSVKESASKAGNAIKELFSK